MLTLNQRLGTATARWMLNNIERNMTTKMLEMDLLTAESSVEEREKLYAEYCELRYAHESLGDEVDKFGVEAL